MVNRKGKSVERAESSRASARLQSQNSHAIIDETQTQRGDSVPVQSPSRSLTHEEEEHLAALQVEQDRIAKVNEKIALAKKLKLVKERVGELEAAIRSRDVLEAQLRELMAEEQDEEEEEGEEEGEVEEIETRLDLLKGKEVERAL